MKYTVKRFSWIKDWMDKHIIAQPKVQEKKSEENEDFWRMTSVNKKLEYLQKHCPESISPVHKKLLEIEEKTVKFSPSWGDGDEYPRFFIYDDGKLVTGNYIETCFTWEKDHWENLGGKRIYNLKSTLLKYFTDSQKEWKNINYLDQEEIDEVLKYLEIIKKEIQTKL